MAAPKLASPRSKPRGSGKPAPQRGAAGEVVERVAGGQAGGVARWRRRGWPAAVRWPRRWRGAGRPARRARPPAPAPRAWRRHTGGGGGALEHIRAAGQCQQQDEEEKSHLGHGRGRSFGNRLGFYPRCGTNDPCSPKESDELQSLRQTLSAFRPAIHKKFAGEGLSWHNEPHRNGGFRRAWKCSATQSLPCKIKYFRRAMRRHYQTRISAHPVVSGFGPTRVP